MALILIQKDQNTLIPKDVDARIGSAALGICRGELDQIIDYLATLQGNGSAVVSTPTEWATDVGLLT